MVQSNFLPLRQVESSAKRTMYNWSRIFTSFVAQSEVVWRIGKRFSSTKFPVSHTQVQLCNHAPDAAQVAYKLNILNHVQC